MLLFVLNFSIIFIAYRYIKTIESVHKAVKVILESMVLLALLGWLQFTAYQIFNIDIFPIYVKDGLIISGIEQTLGFFRMSSLAHEPKSLGILMVVSFFTLHLLNRNKFKIFNHDFLIKNLFVVTALATLSTSAMVLFLILYIYIIISNLRKISLKAVNFLTMLMILLLGIYFREIIFYIIELRVLNRDIIGEDNDVTILSFLSNSPEYIFFGSGIGNIHNLSNDFIPYEYSHYMSGSIYTAKSGYLMLISEYGLIGFTLFFLIIFGIALKLKRLYLTCDNELYSPLFDIFLVVTIAFLSRSYVWVMLIIMIAIFNAISFPKKNNPFS